MLLNDRPLPELSLGWGVLDWCSAYLSQPDGINKGDTWRFTNEQARFLVHFYAVNEHGRFLYRRAILERVKGWGKSPLVAAVCCAELLGPVYFDGWDSEGNPVGRPFPTPLVQIAAISDSQADNTMSLVGAMLADGEAANEYNLDIALSRVLVPGELRKLEKVTASPRGREGNRATFICADETGLWVPAEHGPQLAEALRRNLGKMGGRSIETTNAPAPGENSVAEESHRYWTQIQEGRSFDESLLFDSVSVHVDDIYDRALAMPALKTCYGDATWVDLERIWQEINDPSNRESTCRRFYFNEMTIGESGWLKPTEVYFCRDENLRPLKKSDRIAIGFKGAVRNGAGAVVACRLRDQALFVLKVWEKPDDAPRDWEVDYVAVDDFVRKQLEKRDVYFAYADPHQYQDIVGRWAADFEDVFEEFWLSSKTKAGKAIEQLESAIKTQRVIWNDQPDLERHILNCHIQETPQGDLLRKETADSKRYISVAQAAVLALEACKEAIERGGLEPEADRTLYAY